MSSPCKLSVFCTAYNHEKFIAEALDSFLAQEVDFPFEVLVTDDASTDGTTEIIRSYAEKYPDVIRFFHQEENCFSRGINLYETVMYPNARGKYIAYCEGDDYWTDPSKLNRQVSFLETHPEYSACVHNSYYHYCEGNLPDELLLPASGDRDVPFSTVIRGMSHCFHTSSIVGRAKFMCNPPDFQSVAFSYGFTDYAIALWLSLNGKIRFLDIPMSVYRVNSNPTSWSSNRAGAYNKKTAFVTGEIEMMKTMLPHLNPAQKELTDSELLRRRYELLYLEGKVDEMVRPPFDVLYRQEPLSFRLKTSLKRLFPSLHAAYRSRQGYKE